VGDVFGASHSVGEWQIYFGGSWVVVRKSWASDSFQDMIDRFSNFFIL